ncbi:MAG: hypothetical protein LRY53_01125 [Burkholderiaceae bacterium]|nr:hypothetical protein [Burkholderiaceae bacterium]MCD8564280.1 hypothetical protein [Burkholderiaceae bacterium]
MAAFIGKKVGLSNVLKQGGEVVVMLVVDSCGWSMTADYKRTKKTSKNRQNPTKQL